MASVRSKVAVTIALFALGVGLGACGDDAGVADVVPRSTPEITVPSETTALAAPTTTATTTTATTTTSTTPAASAPSTSAPATTTPGATGGTPSGGQTPDTGGTSGQGFQSFCADNPGAC